MMQFQALQAEFQKVKTELDTKTPELILKKYLGELQALSSIESARIKKGMSDGQKDADEFSQILDLSHQAELKAQSDALEERLAQQQRQHEAEQSDLQRQHEGAMAQMQNSHEADLAAQQPAPAAS